MLRLAFPRLRPPWATLLLATVLVTIQTASHNHLGFSLQIVARSVGVPELLWSEPERLSASTLIHQSWEHLGWNVAGLLLAGWLVESALGRAAILNVALWGGLCGMLVGLLRLEGPGTWGGASGMVFALFGAFLTWRALAPTVFSPLQRNALVWVFFLLWTVRSFASDEPDQSWFHLAGFTYGVGWGLLGLRMPPHWRRRFAALAVALYLVAEAALALRIVRQDPYEIADAMRVLYDTPRPADELNNIAWYWATQPEAPRVVLGLTRDRMEALVEKTPSWAYEDTLATLHYRLGEHERATERERALVERDPAPEPQSIYVSQLARFEYARLAAVDAASLANAPFRLRLVEGGEGRIEPIAPGPVALPRRALVLSDGRLVAYLDLDAKDAAAPVRVASPPGPDGTATSDLAVVPLPVGANAPLRPTRLWWIDPEIARLP